MSSASGPRTSPTTSRSGRMRSDETTRSRGQPGVSKGGVGADAPTDSFDYVADDGHELVIVGEADRRQHDLSVDLDVDIANAHDHDLRHLGIGHKRPKGTEVRVIVRRGLGLIDHCVSLTVEGHARRDGSAEIARFSLPRTVAVQATRPPAIVARTLLVPLRVTSAAGT